MDTNQFRRYQMTSSSSDSDENIDQIIGDDQPAIIKIVRKQPILNAQLNISPKVVIIHHTEQDYSPPADNEASSQSQRSSKKSSRNGPSIYEQMQRKKVFYEYTQEIYRPDNRNSRHQHQKRWQIQYFNKKRNHPPYYKRNNQCSYQHQQSNYQNERDRGRENNANYIRRDYETSRRHMHQNYQHQTQRRNQEENRNNQNFCHENKKNERNEDMKYKKRDQESISDHNRRENERPLKQKQQKQLKEYQNVSSKNQIEKKKQIRQIEQPRQKKQTKQTKVEKSTELQKQNNKLTQNQNQRQSKEKSKSKQTKIIQQPQPKKQQKPKINHSTNNQKQNFISQSHSNNNNMSVGDQSKRNQMDRAQSQIEIQNSIQRDQQLEIQKLGQSVWDESQDEQQQNEESSNSDVEYHELSLDVPLPPVITYHPNDISNFQQGQQILKALQPSKKKSSVQNHSQSSSSQQRLKNHQRSQHKDYPTNQQQTKSFFDQNQMQTLIKMFDKIPLEDQTVFIQLKVRTSNVRIYKIKRLSSEIFGIDNRIIAEILNNPFILIKEYEKTVPNDSEPFSHNSVARNNSTIELKKSKLVLAQIKNPKDLLHHAKLFQPQQEKQLLQKIQANKSKFDNISALISIDEIRLSCSSCGKKKSWLWPNTIIANQCNVECLNIFRFEIEAIYTC